MSFAPMSVVFEGEKDTFLRLWEGQKEICKSRHGASEFADVLTTVLVAMVGQQVAVGVIS